MLVGPNTHSVWCGPGPLAVSSHARPEQQGNTNSLTVDITHFEPAPSLARDIESPHHDFITRYGECDCKLSRNNSQQKQNNCVAELYQVVCCFRRFFKGLASHYYLTMVTDVMFQILQQLPCNPSPAACSRQTLVLSCQLLLCIACIIVRRERAEIQSSRGDQIMLVFMNCPN